MSKLSTDDDNLAVGERLAAVREDQRLSQVEFAERLLAQGRERDLLQRGGPGA